MVATKAGFQGSETGSAELLLYSGGGDPIVVRSRGGQEMAGSYRTDPKHTLVALSTSKSLDAAGTWQATIRPSRASDETLLDQVVDDDWVDIVFWRHGRQWHTMRGLVSDIRRVRAVAGTGATTWSYVLSGYDFQRIFELTPIWFYRFVQKLENVTGEVAIKVFSTLPNLGGDPWNTVQSMLLGWFRELNSMGRANWTMPADMPNTTGTFYDDLLRGWIDGQFSGVPERVAINPNFGNPQGTLWSLAKDWADPAFLELFCDLGKQYPRGPGQLQPNEELKIDESVISVMFRDRPFVLSTGLKNDDGTEINSRLGLGTKSAWFKLPLHVVPRQQIIQDDVGRGGAERFNAFFVSPQVTQELSKSAPPDMFAPLWDVADIKRHGLRRYDVMSRYATPAGKLLFMSSLQRAICRDWYALNPYWLSGSMSLDVGRPEIHVGTRVVVPGDDGDTSRDETYYVEQVSNSWSFGPGVKTQLGVTRGWKGTEADLMAAVDEISPRYAMVTT